MIACCVRRSAAPAAPPPPPPGPASAPDSFMHMPPPLPPSAADFSFAPLPLTPPAASSASSSYSSGSAPPSAPLFGSPPGSGGGAAAGGGGGSGNARFWPGARVLVRADESEGLTALSLSDHSSGEHEVRELGGAGRGSGSRRLLRGAVLGQCVRTQENEAPLFGAVCVRLSFVVGTAVLCMPWC